MDSPETNKKIVASSSTSDSPAVQESPFFNYLCTLSPIKPVKAASHAAQGFPELNIPTPPPVFTSPRLNPQAETNFLKRSKYSQSSNAKLSIEHEDRGYTFAAGSDVPEQSIGQLMVGLVPCTQKACDTKESLQVQPCSPSGFVDEYLSDPVEVDIVNLSDPTDSHLNQIDDAPETLQIGRVRSEESIVKVDNNDVEFKKNMDIGSDMQTEEKTEEVLQGESLAVAEPGKMGDGERRSTEYPDLISKKVNGIDLSNSSLEPVSGEQNVPHVETQSAVSGLDGKRDNDARALSGIVTGEHAGAPSHESVENKIANLELMPEAGQHQRGTLRRCLQFDASAARKKSISSNRGVSNPANINRCSTVAATTTDLKLLESSKLDVATSSNNCGANSSQAMASELSVCPAKTQETNVDKFDRSIRNCGKSFIKSPLPSGIGLHLNSIVNSAAMGCSRSLSINPIENDRPTIQREKSPSVVNLHLSEEPKSSSLPLIVVGKFSAKNYSDRQEIQSIVAENSSTSQFSYENADTFQELNQLSPDNKRKRTYEDEGCKRCNCRRSKCLKLYCECFAAGIYCAEPCACQGCFNKPEYEDMVLGTRQQIETRNPLAFAPKIVRRVTDSPANSGEDNNKVTPSSARHKRGCNCKKSMCLKKYCECYQSGVGCSSGCRCEGCKNAYGVKEGYGEISGMVSRKVDGEGWEDLSDGKLVMETRSSSLPEHRPHNLTPLTPSFQSSNHGKDVPKSRLPYRCLPSPESDTKPLSSYAQSPSSPRNFSIHDKRTKAGEGNFDIVFDQEVEFSATGRMDQFSPRWDRLENICNLTPLPHAPSEAKGISSPSNTDSTNVSRFQLQGSVRFSGSLRWRSSPITPMPRLGGSKLRQESDSDIGYDILEDDTPDILKDTHTPIKAVKATSPNQKRVSPPHGHLHSLRSSASPGLKSGRKFVLQSISSFPSLTPYSDPKDSSSNK